MLVCLLSTACWGQGLQQFEEEFIKIIEQIRPSVVQVTGLIEGHPLTWSGIVLDRSGHIVTAGHMIGQLDRFKVRFLGGKVHEAKKVGYDPETTIGVLKIEGAAESLRPITPARLESVRVGSIAIVVGNPFGFTGSVSTGIISGKGRTIESRRALLADMIQTTAPINPGDSGGLLANSRGEMVGIITSTFGRGQTIESLNHQMQRMLRNRNFQKQMKAMVEYMKRQEEFKKDPQKLFEFLARSMRELGVGGPNSFPRSRRLGYGLSAQGINFVMPVQQVQRITEELIKHGKVARGWLGVSVSSERIRDRKRLLINLVVPDGPAAKAGVVEGDELLRMSGVVIHSMYQLRMMIQRIRPGQKVEMLLRRGEKEILVSITLGQRR